MYVSYLFIYLIQITQKGFVMKDDFIANLFFWFIGAFFIGFFTWVAANELVYLEMDYEQQQVLEEFNTKYGRY